MKFLYFPDPTDIPQSSFRYSIVMLINCNGRIGKGYI